MTDITITYSTEGGHGSLRATVDGKLGAWTLSEDTAAELDVVLTAHYGPLNGTGCGWTSPEDDDYEYVSSSRAPF